MWLVRFLPRGATMPSARVPGRLLNQKAGLQLVPPPSNPNQPHAPFTEGDSLLPWAWPVGLVSRARSLLLLWLPSGHAEHRTAFCAPKLSLLYPPTAMALAPFARPAGESQEALSFRTRCGTGTRHVAAVAPSQAGLHQRLLHCIPSA